MEKSARLHAISLCYPVVHQDQNANHATRTALFVPPFGGSLWAWRTRRVSGHRDDTSRMAQRLLAAGGVLGFPRMLTFAGVRWPRGHWAGTAYGSL